MSKVIAEFGFNTDLEHEDYATWASMGTKYNFNVNGEVLGVFSSNDKNFLLSQVSSSFGDDCMVGTIDAREVTSISKEDSCNTLISNNEPSEECMTISRILSTNHTKEELSAGKSIEQTKGFGLLANLGIQLERKNVQFEESVTVCGVEPTKFEYFKNAKMGKTR